MRKYYVQIYVGFYLHTCWCANVRIDKYNY